MSVIPSPAVRRAVQVLRVLGSCDTGLTLSELARRVGIHRSSCQSILLALEAECFLVRGDNRLTYELGPAARYLGSTKNKQTDPFESVERELISLRHRFQASAIAGRPIAGAIQLVKAAPVPHPFGSVVSSGRHVELAAPTGPLYVAWEDDDTVERWLNAAEQPLNPSDRDRLMRDLSFVRTRGWSATVRQVSHTSPTEPPHEVTESELKGSGLLVVLGMSAPVWDAQGKFLCSLALTSFSREFDGSELRRTARELTAAALRASADLPAVTVSRTA